MLLSAIATFLLVPPVNLLLLAILGVAMAGKWPRLGRRLSGAALGVLLLFGLPVFANGLMAALETPFAAPPPGAPPPAAIVILGGDISQVVQGDELFTTIGPLSLERVQTGAALWRRTALPVLVSGGIVGHEARPVAATMADSLRDDFNVPTEWVEGGSRDTWENAAFTARMLKARGIGSVYVVTHAWHMRRALIAFRHFGLAATAAPTPPDGPPRFFASEFLPRPSAWMRSYYALHEWVGCAWYSVRGYVLRDPAGHD